MSNQSETFSWTAPKALERVTRDQREAEKHPVVMRQLRAQAAAKGLDPETVEFVSIATTPEGNVLTASARRV